MELGFIIKILNIASFVSIIFFSLIAIFSAQSYTVAILLVYIIASTLILASAVFYQEKLESIVSLENILGFLLQKQGRGYFMVVIATLCFGAEMGIFLILSGVMMACTGILNVWFHQPVQQQQPQNQQQQIRTSGYQPYIPPE